MLMSIGDGLKKYVSGQFEALGSNIIIVFPVNLVDEQGRPAAFRGGGPPVGGKTFSEKDVRDIKKLHLGIVKVNPQVQKLIKAKSVSKQKQLNVVGATYEYKEIRSITMAGGRFYNESEVNRSKKVAVLGPTAARDLFPDGNYLGKSVYISSVAFEVIGVTDPRGGGGFGGSDLDDQIYVPITSLQKLVDSPGVDFIVVKASNAGQIDGVISAIKTHLLKSRKADTFSVVDQRQLLGTVQSVIGTLTIGLSGIAAISLVVGGIGVMNMMLVTVTERTREIGLRKALGATPRVILWQFLIESVLLSLTGGVTGILIGAGGSSIVNRFFPTKVSLLAVLLAFGVSTLVGVIFGILPARKAAKLSPINALRYE